MATGSRWVPRSAVYDSHQGVPLEAREDNRGGSKLDILLPLGLSTEKAYRNAQLPALS